MHHFISVTTVVQYEKLSDKLAFENATNHQLPHKIQVDVFDYL